MFKIETTLRSFNIEAPTVADAWESVFILLLDGETVTDIIFAGPFPFLITQVAA